MIPPHTRVGDKQPVLRIAAVQAAPVFLDREATVAKAVGLIGHAAAKGAQLVVFPESFVPCYPVWLWSGRADVEPDAFVRLYANAVEVPGADLAQLAQAAQTAGVAVAIGVTERESTYGRGTLYNTLLILDSSGQLVLQHRKLMPTYKERTVWGQGDGSSLRTVELSGTRVGGLLCWENLMPLARHALYAQGEQIHLAPTADTTDAGWLMTGGSAIVTPGGDCEYLAGPVYAQETILYADLDLGKVVEGKHSFDVAGHYARPDILELRVNRKAQAQWVDATDQ
jgi:nitrilase